MKEDYFTYGEFTLHYQEQGEGAETIICFHGFGRKARDFEVFHPLLKSHQRLISAHLFAHGDSRFPESRIEKKPLSRAEWEIFFGAFLAQKGIDQFHLLGYSMGGRIAMVTALLFRQRVKSLLLIAPDGFKINLIYRFAVGTVAGRMIYQRIIHNPAILFRTADILHRLKILHAKLHRFVYVHMDTREKRQQVHDAWLIYRGFFPDLDALSDWINEGSIKFSMIFGAFDTIIKPKLGEKFCRKLRNSESMFVVNSGHRLLTDDTREFILSHGLWP